MKSLWTDSVSMPQFPALSGSIKTDVLVIGGGMCGLLCAHALQKSDADCVLVDRKRICGGTTQGTTAKITSQHGLIFSKLISKFGIEKTALYLQANEHAVAQYKKLCETIPCDFETKDNYVYLKDDARQLENELAALEKLKFRGADFVQNPPLPFKTAGAVRFRGQAQFDPLLFAAEIAKCLNIYENTEVREIKGGVAYTQNGSIKAKNIIVATHFPFINKHGFYFLKMYQSRSYVLALSGVRIPGGMYIDGKENGISIRGSGDMLLLGGGGHRTGKNGGNFTELKRFAAKYYPSSSVCYMWAAQDCMTLDGIPYIGQYSKTTPHLYVATGFNKWGMTGSMVAADILTDLILHGSSPYRDVFDPSRSILRPQLAVNAFETVTNLLAPTTKRCPHLGCALKWNADEHSWDCPCHGSRFDADGILLDNPATGDLKKS